MYRSDSCPAGMGSYSSDGCAWRWYIPEDLQLRGPNNLLDHLGSIFTPWIDTRLGRLQKRDCFLPTTNSSTPKGWSKKSNFSKLEEYPIQAEVRNEARRDDSKRKLGFQVKDYSQQFLGAHNKVKNLMFRHIPEIEPRVPHLDSRQRNHPDNAETRRNVGGNLLRRVTLPPFTQYN